MADTVATLGIKIDSKPIEKAIKALDKLDKAAKKVDGTTVKLNKATVKTTQVMDKMTKKTTSSFSQMASSAEKSGKKMSDAFRKIEDSAGKAAKNTDSFGESLKTAAKAFSAFIAAKLAKELAQVSDEAINIDNKLRQVTTTTGELNKVFSEVEKISARSRVGISSTAELFQKLSISSEDLGVSQDNLLRITETITKSFSLAGATTAEMDGAIRQLAQGLASGALRGDEFNSVAEQAPLIMRAIAKQTNLSIGELREFAATGGITAEIVVNALQNMEKATDEAFSKTQATSEQAITAIRNNFISWARNNDDLTTTIGAVTDALTFASEGIMLAIDVVTTVTSTVIRFTETMAKATAHLVEFGEFRLGEMLGNEFVELRIGALSFVGAIEKGWAKIKLMTNKLTAAIEFAWDNALARMKNNVGDFLAKVSRALDKVPGLGGLSKAVGAYAKQLQSAGTDVLTFEAQLAKLEKQYNDETSAIDENIDALVADALGMLKATEAGKELEEQKTKTGKATKKTTEATKDEVKAAKRSADSFDKVTSSLKNQTQMLGMSEQAIMLHNALAEAQTNIFTAQGKEIERLVTKYWETKEAQEKTAESTGVFDETLQKLVNSLPPASAGLQKMGVDFDNLIEKGGGFKNILKDVTGALGEFTKGDFSKISGMFGEGGFSLSSIPSNVIQSGGAALATSLVDSFVNNISSGKYNDALDDALPFLQLGRGLSALGINIGGKPSDKTQSAGINLSTGSVTQGGFLSGEKFSEQNRTAADVSAAILSQVSQRLGDLSGNLEFIVGSRDGIRVSFDGEELFKSNEITATLTAATEFLFDMASKTTETYASLAREGESLGEAFLRLDTQFQAVGEIADALGLNFSTVETQAIAAADGLVLAAGGLESFVAKSNFFYDKFFTSEEKFTMAVEDLNTSFDELGIAVPRTREEFKKLVQGIDTNTEAGQALYNSLLTLAPQVDGFIIGLDGWKQKITDVYKNVLEREPDTAGLEHWLNMIESGEMTLDGVTDAIENSTEAWVRNANQVKFTTDATEGLTQASNEAGGALNEETLERFRNATAIEETTEVISRSTQTMARIAQRTQQQMQQFYSSLQDPVSGGGTLGYDPTSLIEQRAAVVEWNPFKGGGSLAPAVTTKIKPIIEEVAENVAETLTETMAEAIDLRPLEVKLLEEQGKVSEALALTRQLEIESVTEAEAAILRQIYAQQDLNVERERELALAQKEADDLARLNAEKEQLEKQRLAQEEANKTQLDAMLRDYAVSFMKLTMEPLDAALFDLQQQTLAAINMATELGATEEQLSIIRRYEQQQREALVNEAQALADSGAAEELAAITQALTDLVSVAYDRLQASVAVEKENITARFEAENDRLKTQFDNDIQNINTRYEMILGGLNSQLDSVSTRVGKLRDIAGQLSSAVDELAPDVTLSSRNAAQSRLTSILDMVRSGADISQFDLSGDIKQLTEPSEQLFSKFSDFALAQARTRVTLGGLGQEAEKQLTDAERQIELLEQQIEQAKMQHEFELEERARQFEQDQERNRLWYESEITRLDQILLNAQMQLDALNGIDNSVMSLQSALSGFASSMQAAVAASAASAAVAANGFGGIGAPNRMPDFTNTGRGKMWTPNINTSNKGGGINTRLPGFANGTDYTPPGNYIVGEQGPEMLSIPGARVTPNDALNMDDVKAEIKRGNYEMIKYLKRVWEIADKQDQIGTPVYTVTAP